MKAVLQNDCEYCEDATVGSNLCLVRVIRNNDYIDADHARENEWVCCPKCVQQIQNDEEFYSITIVNII